jgi:hypothetical protein
MSTFELSKSNISWFTSIAWVLTLQNKRKKTFATNVKWLAHEILMLKIKIKSNFELIDESFFEFCIAVQVSKSLVEFNPFKPPANCGFLE